MTEFLPPTVSEYDMKLGEYAPFNIGMTGIYSFFLTDTIVNADAIGLFFRGYNNSGAQLTIVGDLYVTDATVLAQEDWFQHTYPRDSAGIDWPGVTTDQLASNVILSDVLSGSEGWKWVPIANYTFDPSRVYVIYFLCTTTKVDNGIEDTINIAPRVRFESLINSGHCDIEFWPEGGQTWIYPAAIGLSGEGPEGHSEIININAPPTAVHGDAINISADISNTGSDDTIWVTVYDTDTGEVVGSRDETVLASGSQHTFAWTTTMPDRNFNLRIDTGHIEE